MPQFQIGSHSFEYSLREPNGRKDVAIFYVPGASGGALSSRIDPLENKLLQCGFSMLRMDLWKDDKDLGEKTVRELHGEFDAVVTFLKTQGYQRIGIVGKSIGGGFSLSYVNPSVDAMVLWAPSIGVGNANTVENNLDVKISTIGRFVNVALNEEFLARQNIPIRIIHGTADPVVNISNSESLTNMLAQGELVPLEGADHSYKEEPYSTQVVERTVEFFKRVFR